MLKSRLCLKILLGTITLTLPFYILLNEQKSFFKFGSNLKPSEKVYKSFQFIPHKEKYNNIWLVFTRTAKHSTLFHKFQHLITNLFNISKTPLNIHVIVDDKSKILAEEIFFTFHSNKKIHHYDFYDITKAAEAIEDIVQAMSPHFSSKPGTYYSGALFYLSLGLYRFAPKNESTAVILDCDLYFKNDISLLFQQFKSFNSSILFGLAPELSPVYRHILTKYRLKHKTTFGDYLHPYKISNANHSYGFQGYNTGVILLNLTAIRQSSEYTKLISREYVENLTHKYKFKGHLGDQDYYSLLGFERPDLFYTLSCKFNRQLCTWWKDHGYNDIFKYYFKCDEPIVVLHGNCHSKIPTS